MKGTKALLVLGTVLCVLAGAGACTVEEQSGAGGASSTGQTSGQTSGGPIVTSASTGAATTTTTGPSTTSTTVTTTSSTGSGCAAPCGANCCAPNTTCIDDGKGNLACQQVCKHSAECKNAAAPCCALLANGGGACLPFTGNEQCQCYSGTECTSGSCAPSTNGNLDPVGPYVCKPNDFKLYDGCNGVGSCPGNTCCIADSNNNKFCSFPCQSDAGCGKAHCGNYTGVGSCASGKFCGP